MEPDEGRHPPRGSLPSRPVDGPWGQEIFLRRELQKGRYTSNNSLQRTGLRAAADAGVGRRCNGRGFAAPLIGKDVRRL